MRPRGRLARGRSRPTKNDGVGEEEAGRRRGKKARDTARFIPPSRTPTTLYLLSFHYHPAHNEKRLPQLPTHAVCHYDSRTNIAPRSVLSDDQRPRVAPRLPRGSHLMQYSTVFSTRELPTSSLFWLGLPVSHIPSISAVCLYNASIAQNLPTAHRLRRQSQRRIMKC